MSTKTKADGEAFKLARADLARSGIRVQGPADLEKMGLRALSREEALGRMPDRWRHHAPEGLCCLLFEYRDLRGRPTGFWRLRRLEDAPPGSFGEKRELPRYHQPADSRPYLWFSAAVDWPATLEAAGRGEARLVIVEGEKKAEAVCRGGDDKVAAVGVGGVWNFRSGRLGISVIPDLLEVAEAARGARPVFCYDADERPRTRIHVQLAESRLGDVLRSQGLEALAARLPIVAGSKVGADDYIVREGWGAFLAVLDGAEPLFPKAEPTDVGNATRLARRAMGGFRYVPQWKRWLRWDGRRWAEDDRGAIDELAVEVTKELFREAGDATGSAADSGDAEEALKASKKLAAHALASQRRDRVAAMVKMAPDVCATLKADPRAFDADPWLLNVQNGTLDLRTGELRPHDPCDLQTRLAPVAHDPSAKAARFERFMEEVLPSAEMRGFVQRFLGYALTGDVREHKLAFLHGEGRNGKGVLMGTVAKLMGDYATTVPEALLVAQKGESHPTELTTLKGRRLALVSEVDRNRRWAASRLKRLTGADDITARGMGENFYTFSPTHKFVCLSNPRPRADADDHAIWERLKPVAFSITYRDQDDPRPDRADWPVADKGLEQKLRAEWPGILNWLLEGCLAWQREGLGEPSELVAATAEYRDEQRELDPFSQWVAAHHFSDPLPSLAEFTASFNQHVADDLHGRGSRLTTREAGEKLRQMGYEVERGGHGGRMTVRPPKVVAIRRQRKF